MHLQQQDLGASRDTQNHGEHGREFRKSGIVLLPYRMPAGVKIEVPIVVSVANPSLLCLGGLHGARHGYVQPVLLSQESCIYYPLVLNCTITIADHFNCVTTSNQENKLVLFHLTFSMGRVSS